MSLAKEKPTATERQKAQRDSVADQITLMAGWVSAESPDRARHPRPYNYGNLLHKIARMIRAYGGIIPEKDASIIAAEIYDHFTDPPKPGFLATMSIRINKNNNPIDPEQCLPEGADQGQIEAIKAIAGYLENYIVSGVYGKNGAYDLANLITGMSETLYGKPNTLERFKKTARSLFGRPSADPVVTLYKQASFNYYSAAAAYAFADMKATDVILTIEQPSSFLT